MTAGSSSVWDNVPQAPPDPILGINEAFKNCTHPDKINLSVGAYRTEQGKPLVLNVVSEAERLVLQDPTANKEYLGITGDLAFCKLSKELAFGKDCPALQQQRIITVQGISGTGSVRVGAEYLGHHYPVKVVYIPNPTWGNHINIFQLAGFTVKFYRYFKPETRGLDFEGLCQDLHQAEEGAVLLLHACAHNPTGVDPTAAQWRGILEIAQRRKLLPFFDSAYQGFASGDLDADAVALRMFTNAGLELLLAQSYAKNLGLYGERIGALSVVCNSTSVIPRVESQLKGTIRAMYSNPPKHGAAIVAKVLGEPQLFEQWKVELRGMADRIKLMRSMLREALERMGTPGQWQHITDQIGMFSFTGLTKPQCEYMKNKWHIYLTLNGRISMAGLSTTNVDYVANAIKDSILNA